MNGEITTALSHALLSAYRTNLQQTCNQPTSSAQDLVTGWNRFTVLFRPVWISRYLVHIKPSALLFLKAMQDFFYKIGSNARNFKITISPNIRSNMVSISLIRKNIWMIYICGTYLLPRSWRMLNLSGHPKTRVTLTALVGRYLLLPNLRWNAGSPIRCRQVGMLACFCLNMSFLWLSAKPSCIPATDRAKLGAKLVCSALACSLPTYLLTFLCF